MFSQSVVPALEKTSHSEFVSANAAQWCWRSRCGGTVMEQLTEVFSDLLTQCQERGMKFPLVLVAVGANGSLLALRTNGGGGGLQVLARYSVSPEYQTPINFMIVDSAGEAASAQLEAHGVTAFN